MLERDRIEDIKYRSMSLIRVQSSSSPCEASLSSFGPRTDTRQGLQSPIAAPRGIAPRWASNDTKRDLRQHIRVSRSGSRSHA